MPKFFFHVLDDLDTFDDEGLDLPNLAAAMLGATHSARARMCETLIDKGRISLHHRIEVQDADRNLVGTVEFRDAVEIVD